MTGLMMTDNATILCLITHPEMSPAMISEELGLEPALTQLKGAQVTTPKGDRVDGSTYRTNLWQYRKRLGDDFNLTAETIRFLERLLEKKAFLKKAAESQGKISVFFMATDLHHRSLMLDPDILSIMAEAKIAFGFEFFQSEDTAC